MILKSINLLLLLVSVGAMAQDMSIGRPSHFANNLAFWYTLDAYGVYRDDWGTNDLTNTGTTTSSNSIMGRAPFFNGTTKRLTAATNLAQQVTNLNFTVAFWIYTGTSNQALAGTVGKDTDGSPYNRDEWRCDSRNGANVLNIGNTGGSRAEVTSTNLQLANEWTLVICWRDTNANTINIQVNTSRAKMTETGLFQSTSMSGKPSPGCCSQLEIGAQRASSFYIGYIDDVAMWTNRILTAQEKSMIWNSGVGGLSKFMTPRGGGNP